MAELITIAKYRPPNWSPAPMNYSLSRLHRIDEHLYSFMIFHPDIKYPYIRQTGSFDPDTKKHFDLIEVIDPGDKDYWELRPEDWEAGHLKGGAVKIRYRSPIVNIVYHQEDLKWETQMFLLIDHENGDLWEIEGVKDYTRSPSAP